MTGAARTPQVRWVVAATDVHGDDVVDFDCLDGAPGSADHAHVSSRCSTIARISRQARVPVRPDDAVRGDVFQPEWSWHLLRPTTN